MGVEPMTFALQVQRSTTKLKRLYTVYYYVHVYIHIKKGDGPHH